MNTWVFTAISRHIPAATREDTKVARTAQADMAVDMVGDTPSRPGLIG